MILKKNLISNPYNPKAMNSTLKSTQANIAKNENTNHLKVIKSKVCKKIYVNTLTPNFSYLNSSGELITQKNCALL